MHTTQPPFLFDCLPKAKTIGLLQAPALKQPRELGSSSKRQADWDTMNRALEVIGRIPNYRKGRNSDRKIEKVMKHAEGQAALFLWKNPGIRVAWLDINNDYVCAECQWWVPILMPRHRPTMYVRFQVGGVVKCVEFDGGMPPGPAVTLS